MKVYDAEYRVLARSKRAGRRIGSLTEIQELYRRIWAGELPQNRPPTVEWSRRRNHSVGFAYYTERRIILNRRDPFDLGDPRLLFVIHEAAHILACDRYGTEREPGHGVLWRVTFLELLADWFPAAERPLRDAYARLGLTVETEPGVLGIYDRA